MDRGEQGGVLPGPGQRRHIAAGYVVRGWVEAFREGDVAEEDYLTCLHAFDQALREAEGYYGTTAQPTPCDAPISGGKS